MTHLTGPIRWLALVTVVVMAVSFGPSFAHVLEAPPRLGTWSPELWREATVFNGQFAWFAIVGAPLDVGSIILGAVFAFSLRGDRAFRFALAAALFYALALGLWFSVVAPANSVLATWVPGPMPDDFAAIRDRWEGGHMAVTAAKFCGLVCVVLAALCMRRAPG